MGRDSFIDFVKAILISLVVYGHICNMGFVKNFIYLFHMPLFVFISGYLSNGNKVVSLKRYITMLLSFSFIYWGYCYLLFNYDITHGMKIYPPLHLWYIWCLFIYRFILFKIKFSINKLLYFIYCLFFISIISSFIPLTFEFSFGRLFFFFPFFMIGYLFNKKELLCKIYDIKWHFSVIAILLSIIPAIYLPILEDYNILYYNGNLIIVSLRMVYYLVSIPLVFSLLNVIYKIYGTIKQTKITRFIENIGRCTLPIYLFHNFFCIFYNNVLYNYYFFNSHIARILFSIFVCVFIYRVYYIMRYNNHIRQIK